ncbi:zinc ribbon domain-containing protein [Lysinibacillus sp. CTST325]
MKNCLACGHAQDDGRFCGKCGAPIENAAQERAATTHSMSDEQPHSQYTQTAQSTTQSNEQIELIKKNSKLYFNYFFEQLKMPSANFNVEATWKNSLASMIIYVVLTALSVYVLTKNIFSGGFGIFQSLSPSFIQVFFYMSLFISLLIAISVLGIFLTSKLFSESQSFTNVIRKIGNYYTLPIAFAVLSILFGLFQSFKYSIMMIYGGVALVIGIIPIFVMIKLLSNKSKTIDSFYGFIFYLIVAGILSKIIFSFIIDSAIGQYLNYLL